MKVKYSHKLILRRAFLSSAFSLATLIISYIAANIPFPLLEQMNLFAWVEYFTEKTILNEKDDYSDVLFVNTAFDKGLAEYYNPYANELLGTRDVTDRKKLLEFLNRVDSLGGYRCVFLDIMFNENYKTKYDSTLFSKIKSMEKTIFVRSSQYAMADSSMIGYSGLCDYYATITDTNFTRYQYLQDDGSSVALKLNELIGGKLIKKHCGGLWYTIGGELCYNCQFLTKFDSFDEQIIDEDGNTRWDNMGNDIMKWWNDETLKKEIAGQIIILGNFYEDRHDVYMGNIPGPVISYKAFKAIENKDIIVNWRLTGAAFLFYLSIFYYLIWMKPISNILIKKMHNRNRNMDQIQASTNIWTTFLSIIISFISIGTILSIISAFLYVWLKIGINVIVPTLAFSIAKLYKNNKISII